MCIHANKPVGQYEYSIIKEYRPYYEKKDAP